MPEVKQRLEKLRDQGAERAAGLRDRAESFRSTRSSECSSLQARAFSSSGVATREEVHELSRELERLAKRFEKSARRVKPTKGSGEA